MRGRLRISRRGLKAEGGLRVLPVWEEGNLKKRIESFR